MPSPIYSHFWHRDNLHWIARRTVVTSDGDWFQAWNGPDGWTFHGDRIEVGPMADEAAISWLNQNDAQAVED